MDHQNPEENPRGGGQKGPEESPRGKKPQKDPKGPNVEGGGQEGQRGESTEGLPQIAAEVRSGQAGGCIGGGK